MRRLRTRPSYATTTATLALVVALGGGTYALAGERASGTEVTACVTKSGSAKGDVRIIRKGACRASERTVTWNQVGPTGPRGPAGPAGSPDTASQVLAKLATVDGPASGLDADTLDGRTNEAWRVVGATGQPAFQNGWSPFRDTVRFTKDATDVVHIQGQVKGGTVSPNTGSSAVFQLPPGYEPTMGEVYISALTTNGNNVITPGWVVVGGDGRVAVGVGNNAFVSIDVSFRR